MQTVLLTGASGFVGRHCITPLTALGYEVHCVSSRDIQAPQDNVQWHKANLLSSADITSLIAQVKPEKILHLAWYVEPGKVINDPCNIEWVENSLQLLRLFHENGGKRAVFAGSNYEYDLDYGYLSEANTPRKPNTVYGTAKNCLYELFRVYCEQTGIKGAWGRIFDLYGPFENPHRLVPYVVLSMLKGEVAKTSHARQIRDFMHVQDVANGFVHLLDGNLCGDYNIASGQTVTLKKILYEIADLMNTRDLLDIGAIPARENEPPFIVANVSKFQQASSWAPQHELRSGLENTIHWWKQNQNYHRE